MEKSKILFKQTEKPYGNVLSKGVRVNPIEENWIRIRDDEFEITPNIRN